MPTLETQKQSRKSQLLTLNFFSQVLSNLDFIVFSFIFASCVNVLMSYPALVEESQFVLVGGVGDVGWGGMFPRSGVCDVVLIEV